MMGVLNIEKRPMQRVRYKCRAGNLDGSGLMRGLFLMDVTTAFSVYR